MPRRDYAHRLSIPIPWMIIINFIMSTPVTGNDLSLRYRFLEVWGLYPASYQGDKGRCSQHAEEEEAAAAAASVFPLSDSVGD